MITGLVQVRARAGVRARRSMVVGAAVAVIASAGLGSSLVLTQDGGDVGALIDDLAEVEERLAGIPLLPDVTVVPEETWGTISGDFVGNRIILEEADADLQDLVARASDAGDEPVPNAIENVAGSYRTMLEGYTFLAAYEQAGLAIAPPAVGGEGEDAEAPAVAEGVDEPRGQAEVGLELLLNALAGFEDGYVVLQDAEAAGDARTLFQSRFSQVQQAAQLEALDVRDLLSRPATERLVPVTRFEPRFSGEAPANVVRYACFDWDDYTDVRPVEPVPDLQIPEGDQADLPIPDCPDLANDNDVRVVEPGAAS